MSSRRLLVIGGILALATVVLLNVYVGRIRASEKAVSVLRLRPGVALAKSQTLGPDMLERMEVPERFRDMLGRAIPATPEATVWLRDRPVTRDVPDGSVLLYEHFEDDPEVRFAARVAEGMRGLSIPVDASSAVSFFVEPGSRVDVLATLASVSVEDAPLPGSGRSVPRATREVATRTLLQNVRVLAVGRATTRGSYLGHVEEGFGAVTLEVTPLQAEKLVFALEHARRGLTLVLRNPADASTPEIPSVDWSSLERIR